MPSAILQNRTVAVWLFVCVLMVFLMVVIGGLTRLTESGLSMTRWQPVTGIFPPTTETAWEEEFASYRNSPEYRHKNIGISLHEFQQIFWLEYIHRVIGRVTGLVFLLPLLWFWWRKQLTAGQPRRLSGIFLLGGLQGLMGWYMVKSGLVDDPRVSPYRLTAHLLIACLIFSWIFWEALKCWYGERQKGCGSALGKWVVAAVIGQIALGGLVAGNDAGLTYNTYPLMDGDLVPSGMFLLEPWYLNFFENVTMVQFIHRWFAWVAVLLVVFWGITVYIGQKRQLIVKKSFLFLTFVISAQVIWKIPSI